MIKPSRLRFAPIRRSPVAWLVGGWLLLVPPLIAAPGQSSARLFYDLPADTAEKSLLRFSAQSGLEVLFATQVTANVTTKAVQGEFTAMEAVSQMLAGTVLRATLDTASGAVAVRRFPPESMNKTVPAEPHTMTLKKPKSGLGRMLAVGAAFIAGSISTLAQTNSAAVNKDTPAAQKDEPLELKAFEVTTTQDKGYFVTNAGNAMKTGEKLMEIPQSVFIITSDMIKDIGAFDLSDILNYSGIGSMTKGEAATIRGFVVPNITTDGGIDAGVDTVTLDSITVVRGPVAVLYGFQSALTGTVVKTTKVPLAQKSGALTGRIDQRGSLRGELDYSSPLGKIGRTKFSFRVAAAHDEGKLYFRNLKSRRDIGYGVFEAKNADGVVRLSAQFQDIDAYPHKNQFLGPDHQVYTGAGREESYQPKGMTQSVRSTIFRGQFIQRVFDNWTVSARGAVSSSRNEPVSVALVSAVNHELKTVSFTSRRNEFNTKAYSGTIDAKGEYRLFGRKMMTLFGLYYTDLSSLSSLFGDTQFGARNGQTGNTFTVPMDNPNTASWVLLPANQYPLPVSTGLVAPVTGSTPNQGTITNTVTTTFYFQQNIEILPKRLNLTLGIGQLNHSAIQRLKLVPKVTFPTVFAEPARQDGTPYRVGVVFNVTQELALWALKSQMILPRLNFLIDGTISPAVIGETEEIGFKTDFWNGRVSSTVAVYESLFTNFGLAQPGVSPLTGRPYVILVPGATVKGYDVSLFLKPTPNWQVTLSAVRSKVTNPHNVVGRQRVAHTFEEMYSIYTRYNFTADPLRKFSLGGGAFKTVGRVSAAGNFRYPTSMPNGLTGGVTEPDGGIEIENTIQARTFAEYRLTQRWTLRLDVDNLFDQVMVIGLGSALAVDASAPRTFTFAATRRF